MKTTKNPSATEPATTTERSDAEGARIDKLIDELLDKVHGGTGLCAWPDPPIPKPIPDTCRGKCEVKW